MITRLFITGFALFWLLNSTPGHAEEIADGPYSSMGLLVTTMFSCTLPEADKSSHCFVGVVSGVGGTMLSANTEVREWLPTAIGCGIGIAKEIRDHQGFGTADPYDAAWTCGAAALSSYATNGIITFYNNKGSPYVGVKLAFSTGK